MGSVKHLGCRFAEPSNGFMFTRRVQHPPLEVSTASEVDSQVMKCLLIFSEMAGAMEVHFLVEGTLHIIILVV